MALATPFEHSTPAWRRELAAMLAIAWPLILTNAVEMLMNATSTAVIGRIGPAALAAVTLALGLYNLALLLGIGATAAVSALTAEASGRGHDLAREARRIVEQGLVTAVLLVLPLWAVLWNAQAILEGLGQEPALAALGAAYLHVQQWALLPIFVYLVLRSAFAALGRPRWALVAGLTGVAVNAGLNPLLVFGVGPVGGLGLAGAGLAIIVSNLVMAALLVAAAMLDPHLRRFRLLGGVLRPSWHGLGRFWSVGLPIGISLLLETGLFSAAGFLIGRVEPGALPAHAVALQVASATFMVPLGIAQGATIRIGRAFGARDREGVLRAGRTALSLSLFAMTVFALCLVVWPDAILGLFLGASESRDAELRRTTIALLDLAALFQLADGAQVTLAGMLRGLQDTRVPMLISAAGYWGVGFPAAAALAFMAGLGARGVWLGLAASLFVVTALLFLRWSAKTRRI